jgi:hypothetical protein
MPSGYDKSPYYGGPRRGGRTTIIAAMAVALMAAWVWWVIRG